MARYTWEVDLRIYISLVGSSFDLCKLSCAKQIGAGLKAPGRMPVILW